MKLCPDTRINYANGGHSRQTFDDCVALVGENNCDYAYFSIPRLDELKTQTLEKEIVLIAIKDHLHAFLDFTWYPDSEQLLIDLANENPNKLFVLFLEYFSDTYLTKLKKVSNIKIVLCFGNLTDDLDKYLNLTPANKKNFDSDKTSVCLNRYAKPHRLVLLSYLYGSKLDKYTHLSLLKLHDKINFETQLLDLVNWEFADGTNDIQNIVKPGFRHIFQNRKYLANGDEPYDLVPGTQSVLYFSNARNFENNLHEVYTNSFLEIIPESMYDTKFGSISEKFLNSIYGYNFPILIAVPGAVQFLRDLGFDMFDDIIDHSYDQIDDNLKRIHVAIDRNRHLITNKENLIDHWKKSIPRFAKNLDFARNTMPSVIHHSVIASFTKCIGDSLRSRVE